MSETDHLAAGTPLVDRGGSDPATPSPRLRGAGRGEGAFPSAQAFGSAPSSSASRRPLPASGARWDLRRVLRVTAIGGAAATVCLLALFIGWVVSLGPPPLGQNLTYSTLVVDREGRLLRPYTTDVGRWRLPATRADVDPRFFNLLFAYEDRRFLSHHGIDALA